jgi:peptidoglycan/xylan/chitin deacetylase (PgdA/CDA1 family)
MTKRTVTLLMATAIMSTTSWAQKPVERVETDQPLVAITFDDGPNPVNGPKLLALFKKTGVRATFFVNGNNLRKHPELAKRMVAEGHELGNHTTSHANLAKLGDLEKVRKQIEETQTIMKETVGKPAAVFRAPFLSHDKNVWTVLNGMPAINASRDTKDWSKDSTVESIIDKATKETKAGDIILMHSWSGKTIEAMPKIVKALQAKGLKLVTVTELLAAAKKPAASAAAKSKGKRMFLTGHSFFIAGGYMAKKVNLLAKAAGKEDHEMVGWRYSGGRSGAVDKWWAKGADQEPRKSVAAGKVDILTVCTYYLKKGSEQEKCVRNFVKLMQESNPDGLVYLITTKIPSDGKYKGGWDARTKAELATLSGWIDKTHRYANHHGALVDEINKAYGKTVIKAVPLYYGQALLRAEIIDGKVPGVKKQSELYSDAMGHVSELGQRLNAYTTYAALYGESPVGLHVPKWEPKGDAVAVAQNLVLQKVALAAVQAVPVTRTRRNRSIEKRAERNPSQSAEKPVVPATTKSKGKRIFIAASSFYIAGGYMAKKLNLLADAAGKEEHELVGWRFSPAQSGTVDKWWKRGADEEPRKSVAAGKVDALAVCGITKMGSKGEKAVKKFVKLMQDNNPAGRIYVLSAWIP